jgi:hypothetical protein
MQFDTVRARAVYVPAYVLEYQHAGQFFRAVVHGATGEVGAERHLSAVKVSCPATCPGESNKNGHYFLMQQSRVLVTALELLLHRVQCPGAWCERC